MSLLPSDFLDHQEIHPSLREKLERYGDQGGLLGILVYVFTYLESEDEQLAGTAAEIPPLLFVSSSLHDDAIDETDLDSAVERAGKSSTRLTTRQFLNQHVTIGDLVFTHLIDRLDDLPDGFETGKVASSIRTIGSGQLDEDGFGSSEASKADAIRRLDQRGSVWGDLVATVVGASGSYSDDQLERLTTVSRNILFVYTVFDDVEDLPEDIENGVANAPVMLLEEGAVDDADSSEAVVDAVLESDVPDQLDALVEAREAEVEAAVRRFHKDGGYSNEAILEATSRALEWYAESVCSRPLEESVSEASQRTIREQLTGDDATKREYIDSIMQDAPLYGVPADEIGREAATLSGRRLAPAITHLVHVQTLAAATMPMHLEDAFSRLREKNAA
ncbi:class 1 isoprenoid biosynthesis enzyme [Halostagnicola bangensis]